MGPSFFDIFLTTLPSCRKIKNLSCYFQTFHDSIAKGPTIIDGREFLNYLAEMEEKMKISKKQIQETLYVTVGSFLLAVSINTILLPNKIVAGVPMELVL